MKKTLLSFLCSLSTILINAQTFTNSVGGPIPDNNVYTNFNIVVSGLPTAINTSSFGLEYVTINVVHPNDADLRMKLQSPTGSLYVLTSFYGGNGANYTNTSFDDSSSVNIASGTAPFTGVFHSVDPLANFNNGQNPNGTWILTIRDQTVGNVGSVSNWSITFGSHPSGGVNFTSSNLPIVELNTFGVTIPDSPNILAQMSIIYNGPGVRNYLTDPFNDYNNKIGIQLRGSSSQSFPQKQYGVVSEDTAGNQHDTTILGFPTQHDWILYAPYDDKTCMRNVLTYNIANETGHYASRTKFCELILNGQYQGIYVLEEKIKRDKNRVNIAKLDSTTTSGDSLTGGYIIKIDKTTGTFNGGWNSPFPSVPTGTNIFIQYDYPGGSITPVQKTYIQNYVDSFETALSGPNFADPTIGWRMFASEGSFIDYFLVSEICRNVDSYRLSTYLHKDKDSKGGKLKAGPMWDYNLAWWNANYCNGDSTGGWAYKFNYVCGSDGYQVPFWWGRFMQDPVYVADARCRWEGLRQNILSLPVLDNYIDSLAAYLGEAEVRHFIQWPIIGVYTWPNPSPIPTSYAGEITAMKNWIAARVAWMDANLPGTCTPSVASFYSNDTIVCAGDSVKFHDNSTLYPTSWSWSFPGGSPSTSNLQNPKIQYPASGTYSVTLTATNPGGTGLPTTFTSYIVVNPAPVTTVDSVTICSGATANLTANGASTYVWSAGATSTGVNTASATPAASTTYTVTGTIGGCADTAVSLVTVDSVPVTPTITVVGSVLTSSAATGNQWYLDSVIIAGATGQNYTVTSNGNYSDVVTLLNCSSPMSAPQPFFTVGINSLVNNNAVVIYPNPFSDNFYLSFYLARATVLKIEITDVLGRVVKVINEKEFNQGASNLEISFANGELKSGIYFLKVISASETITKKLTKME